MSLMATPLESTGGAQQRCTSTIGEVETANLLGQLGHWSSGLSRCECAQVNNWGMEGGDGDEWGRFGCSGDCHDSTCLDGHGHVSVKI